MSLREVRAGRQVLEGDLRLVEQLRVSLVQVRNLPSSSNDANRSVSVLVKLDNHDVYQSTSAPKTSNCVIADELVHEIATNFSTMHLVVCESTNGRSPRSIGRVSVKKREIVRNAGKEMTVPLKRISRHNDVQGQICLDVRYDQEMGHIEVSVVDYAGLSRNDHVDLYLYVSVQGCCGGKYETKKLKIGPARSSDPVYLECSCEPPRQRHRSSDTSGGLSSSASTSIPFDGGFYEPELRLSLWHDVLGGLNSFFHGQIRIPLDHTSMQPRGNPSGPQWYHLKPRSLNDSQSSSDADLDVTMSPSTPTTLGDLKFRVWYTADHVLPLERYSGLHRNLLNSLSFEPFSASLASVLQVLPTDLESIAKPLMKIFVQANLIRPFFRVLCSQYMATCQDVNTLFRNQSMASKIMYELMKFIGHQYLKISLKPLIDMIYNERKCCEIDPCKLKPGDSLEQNTQNLVFYGECAFSRVVNSNNRCPQPLKEIFSDLREVVGEFFPHRSDIQRLALSSFIIMRFFAAAILNPKLFGLRREQPEGDVLRTLVLLSKILQRLSNCVVSQKELTVKEQWLAPVLTHFTDEEHQQAMAKFLDQISLASASSESSASTESISVLKDGQMVERRTRADKKRCLKNLIHQKKRHVVLTESELSWQKIKEPSGEHEPKGRFSLAEITAVTELAESKNAFRVVTPTAEVHFQATTSLEMNDWIALIQSQQRRHLRLMKRPSELSEWFDIDTEHELETIHMTLFEHAETLKHWKNALDGTAALPPGVAELPVELLGSAGGAVNCGDEGENSENIDVATKERLYNTIQETLHSTLMIEKSHRATLTKFINQVRNGQGTRENPIGQDDNYLLIKSRLQKTVPI
ncbi:hypothetical protein QR680_017700 [Steinernema hermaphroditum]|uniref:Ras-GAP domain-containing protein n=1 Tax=Steinernema hermaphroditum TaxID=289476 RepID=A0AA39HFI5_9BILA|nr:hypothetical protein QR680_017700 [Steinernema hermaphroditum]